MNKLYRYPVEGHLIQQFMLKVTERTTFGATFHWHDFYEIELYLHGSGTTTINGTEYPIQSNTLCMMTPADIHDIRAAQGERLTLINLTFVPECLENSGIGQLVTFSQPIVTRVDDAAAQRLVWLMHRIQEEYSLERFLSKDYTASLIGCILIELLRMGNGQQKRGDFPLPVQKAIYYLRTHFKEPITLEDTAKFAGFSPSYMSRLFREYVGTGLKEYLVQLRLEHGEQLLRFSDQSVTEVAEYCGFDSVSHFIHIFRSRYGVPPLRYRKMKKLKSPVEKSGKME